MRALFPYLVDVGGKFFVFQVDGLLSALLPTILAVIQCSFIKHRLHQKFESKIQTTGSTHKNQDATNAQFIYQKHVVICVVFEGEIGCKRGWQVIRVLLEISVMDKIVKIDYIVYHLCFDTLQVTPGCSIWLQYKYQLIRRMLPWKGRGWYVTVVPILSYRR